MFSSSQNPPPGSGPANDPRLDTPAACSAAAKHQDVPPPGSGPLTEINAWLDSRRPSSACLRARPPVAATAIDTTWRIRATDYRLSRCGLTPAWAYQRRARSVHGGDPGGAGTTAPAPPPPPPIAPPSPRPIAPSPMPVTPIQQVTEHLQASCGHSAPPRTLGPTPSRLTRSLEDTYDFSPAARSAISCCASAEYDCQCRTLSRLPHLAIPSCSPRAISYYDRIMGLAPAPESLQWREFLFQPSWMMKRICFGQPGHGRSVGERCH